jgi:hypothetical protein
MSPAKVLEANSLLVDSLATNPPKVSSQLQEARLLTT